MKRFEKFLFFYSIVAITIIFIATALYNPTPLNVIFAFALFPFLLYFWLRVTSAHEVGPAKWSGRFVLVVFLLSLLGLFGASLNQERAQTVSPEESKIEALTMTIDTLNEKNLSNEELREELLEIQLRLDELRGTSNSTATESESLSDLLKEESGTSYLGEITVKTGAGSAVPVYKSPSELTQKVGEMEYGTNYPYTKINGDWYEVSLPTNITGWVNSKNVFVVSDLSD